MIKFHCSHCQQKLGVPDEYAGRRIRCSKCSQPSVVPSPVEPHIPVAAVVKPKPVDEAELVQDDILQDNTPGDDAARMEAIRLAGQERARAAQKQSRPKNPKQSGDKSSAGSKKLGFSFSLSELVPDILRVPLGIGFALVGAAVMVGVWVVCSRAGRDPLCFMAVFVPIAAAGGVRLFVPERGFLIGMLCIIIGALGIAGGKAAIASCVVIPYLHQTAEEEILTDVDTLLADPDLQYTSSASIKPYANDGDYMTCAALVSLVRDGQADPVKTRSWAVHILLYSNKLSVIEFIDKVSSSGGVGADRPPIPDLTAEDETVLEQASMRMGQWYDEETEIQQARTYYPAVSKLTQQAKILHTFQDKKLTYQLAFISTLGLFDLTWIFIGLGLAYITAVFD